MAGLYIHIPFCKSRCIYCGFYSTTNKEWRQRYVDAVCHEMQMRPSLETVTTIYLGGGTPSQLNAEQLRQLFDTIYKVYAPIPTEITIECNPDDITEEFCTLLKTLPVNRISMGAQTFSDERLRFLHRRHTAYQVPEAVKRLRDAGIHNISIDLMYGFPNETLVDWERDIDTVLALQIEHISAYCLMVEEGTVLSERLKLKDERLKMPDEELERQMYELLIDKLTAAGYEHYEISNFARSGYRSQHNSSYWNDVTYIGLGAAAHSYVGRIRSWNVSDLQQYITSIECDELPSEHELTDDDTHYNDRITTALRTSDGLNLGELTDKHRRYCLKEAQRFLADGLLTLHDQQLRLTRRGLFVSDYIMSSLMLV